MDSEVCERCGGLIGYFGFCLDCGYDGCDWHNDDDENEEPTIGTPEEAQSVALSFSDADIERYIETWVSQGWLTIL